MCRWKTVYPVNGLRLLVDISHPEESFSSCFWAFVVFSGSVSDGLQAVVFSCGGDGNKLSHVQIGRIWMLQSNVIGSIERIRNG